MKIESIKELAAVQEEIEDLSKKLFGKDKFVVFSEEEKASKEYKRYNELMAAKMEYLSGMLTTPTFFVCKNGDMS